VKGNSPGKPSFAEYSAARAGFGTASGGFATFEEPWNAGFRSGDFATASR
jgi:hypothetical protein